MSDIDNKTPSRAQFIGKVFENICTL